MKVLKDEMFSLVPSGVLIQGIESSWKSSSFFRKKNNGSISFVSNFAQTKRGNRL